MLRYICTYCHATHGVGFKGKNVHVALRMYVLLRHALGGLRARWGKNSHVTLPLYVLLRHAWGGVWGNNFHAALLMYVQTIDRVWLNLKSRSPPKLRVVEKKAGHHFLNKGVNRMIQHIWWQPQMGTKQSDRLLHHRVLQKTEHISGVLVRRRPASNVAFFSARFGVSKLRRFLFTAFRSLEQQDKQLGRQA